MKPRPTSHRWRAPVVHLVVLGFCLMTACPATAGADERPIVAVFEIEDRAKTLSAADREQLCDYLGTLLTKGGYQVVPRAQLKERLVGAKKGSYKACYDQSCQIELGRELAAQKSLSSQVLRFGKHCKVTVNLYDLKRATSEGAGSHSGACKTADIVASLERAVETLTGGAGAETSRPPPEAITVVGERIAAYERGEKEHAYDIAMAYLEGKSGAPQNNVRAKQWFAKAAAHGDTAAYVRLGDAYLFGQGTRQNKKEALNWYRKSAAADDAEGQEKLADMYYSGADIKRDYVEAAKWYRKAAANGERAEPCNFLGRMYLSGEGVKPNRAEALKWFIEAEQRGLSSATSFIALIYEGGGDGVVADKAEAADWLRAGARGGYTPAMIDLARAHVEGRIPGLDAGEAYGWLAVYIEKEARTDHAEALQKKLAAKMSPADLDRARQEAAEMIKKYVTPQDREEKAYFKTLKGR